MSPASYRGSVPDKLRIARLEYAVRTMAGWLVQAQTGFGEQDARGIFAILDGERDEALAPRDKEDE